MDFDPRGTPKQEYEQRRLLRLTGSYRHQCNDWDFLAIDEHDPEFKHCHCVIQGALPGTLSLGKGPQTWANLARRRTS